MFCKCNVFVFVDFISNDDSAFAYLKFKKFITAINANITFAISFANFKFNNRFHFFVFSFSL